jgi:hypothetical protein
MLNQPLDNLEGDTFTPVSFRGEPLVHKFEVQLFRIAADEEFTAATFLDQVF